MRWLPVARFKFYEISREGIVRWATESSSNFCPKGKIIRGCLHKGYRVLWLSTKKGRRQVRLHVALLETFVCLKPKGMETLHLDGNKLNNKLSNLRWGTHTENMRQAVQDGWRPFKRKLQNQLSYKGVFK